MATITVSYDANNDFARKMIAVLKASSAFTIKKEKEERYNPEFVKMIKERADNGKRRVLTPEEQKELFSL